jgi:hypothetical protein
MNRPTLSVRYDGTVRIVFPGESEKLRAALAEVLELATDLLRVTAAPVEGGRADKAIMGARDAFRVAALDCVAVELSMEDAKSFSTNLQMTLARAGNHDIGPLCEAWTAGFGVCSLPEHHAGPHRFERPLGPEHQACLAKGGRL